MPVSSRVRGKSVWITWTGDKELLHNLKLTADQRKHMQRFMLAEANRVKLIAKKIVPVLTGRLRDTHRTTVNSHGDLVGADIIAGGISMRGKMVNYAAAIHQGFHHNRTGKFIKGNPWLATAMHINSAGYMRRLVKAIKFHKGKKGL